MSPSAMARELARTQPSLTQSEIAVVVGLSRQGVAAALSAAGSRRGPRPGSRSVRITVSLPADIAAQLRAEPEPASAVVRQALRARYSR